jgi:hypothetical protein
VFGVRIASLREMSGSPLREPWRAGPECKLRALVLPQGPADEHKPAEAAVAECNFEHNPARPRRIGWARLLKRVFDIDMHRCPSCGGGALKIIAPVLERPVIE